MQIHNSELRAEYPPPNENMIAYSEFKVNYIFDIWKKNPYKYLANGK